MLTGKRLLRVLVVTILAFSANSCSSGNGDEGDVFTDVTADGSVDVTNDMLDDSMTEDGDSSVLPDGVEPEVSPDAMDINWDDVAAVQPSEVGQVVITEFMAQSQGGADSGEWVELYNGSDQPVDLKGCSLHDDEPDNHIIAQDLRLNPGSYAVLARSADPVDNHGLEPDYIYSSFTLNNMGDQIVLTCGNTEVDRVEYGVAWVTLGRSIQLSLDKYDATLNDGMNNWCDGKSNYGVKGKLGTPGLENYICPEVAPCENNPCTNPLPASCEDEVTVLRYASPGICTEENGLPHCEYEAETVDCSLEFKVCLDGECVEAPNPCQPNPCTQPPVDHCEDDGLTLVSYPNPGTCEVVDGGPSCSYPETSTNCSDDAKICGDAVCKYPGQGNAPAVGQVIFTEFMARSQGGADPGEWVELYNLTDGYLDVGGCLLKDDDTDAHEFPTPTILPPLGFVVMARSSDTTLNHGLEVDYEYTGFSLSNTTDELVIQCGDTTIDRVAYDGTWVELATAIQLDLEAFDSVSNDERGNWCLAETTYGTDGMLGTPGEDSIPCPEPPTIAWCRLESPAFLEDFPGTLMTFVGRVEVPGITDKTAGVDSYPLLEAQGGYGERGTDPAVASGWIWGEGTPTAEWDDTVAGMAGVDEYRNNVSIASPGEYDVAYRFSVDGGLSWTYCDLNAGAGSDGTEDDYQVENAGHLNIQAPSPCMPNPCDLPPEAICDEDGVTLHTFVTPGVCTEDGLGGFTCAYEEPLDVDCSLSSKVCVGSVCIGEGEGVLPTEAGQIIVTEFMARSQAGTDNGEWVELYNASLSPLDLKGCHLMDDGTDDFPIAQSVVLAPGDYVVIARSGDPQANHGVTFTLEAGSKMTLANTEDEIVLACGNDLVEIDRVNYATPWVVLETAIQLSPDAYDAVDNDDIANWCLATASYGTSTMLGTPEGANETCAPPEPYLDWCELLEPVDVELLDNNTIDASAMVSIPVITDFTSGIDTDDALLVDFGVGPRDVDPDGSVEWVFTPATGMDPYDDSLDGVVGADGYVGFMTDLAPGTYDFAFRVSLDSGATWTYCDAAPGSSNGYDVADAGKLTIYDPANPCEPNQCNLPPLDYCQDDNTLVVHLLEGLCTVDNMEAVCDYDPTPVACADTENCVGGECVLTGADNQPVSDGDIIVTEFMARSAEGSGDNGEWVELYNPTLSELDLLGCTLSDEGGNLHVIAASLPVAAAGYVVLAKSLDPVANWGLAADYSFGADFTLGNSGDEIILQCGDPAVTIDRIDYTTSNVVLSTSWQLGLSSYSGDNNDMSLWCPGTAEYGTDGRLGTPGLENAECQ